MTKCIDIDVYFRWGLNPKMHALQTQPTVSPTLIHHIQRGDIKIVPDIMVSMRLTQWNPP